MEHKYDPIMLEAEIEIVENTKELEQEIASIVPFPENKTPDILCFSGIFVSSGENLNKAFFLPSELVKSHKTIDNKALDIEHDETQIVGHIYSSAFVDSDGKKLDIDELKNLSESELNRMDIDVMIAGIIYKNRFPELAKEVQQHKWKLSMETYFQDYDIKIGDLILTKKEAESLGLASDNVIGRMAKVLRKGKEIAKGEVARVLRNLLFCGCGLVKNPANPKSIILETANDKKENTTDEIIIELTDDIDHSEKATVDQNDKEIKKLNKSEKEMNEKEEADIDATDIRTQTSTGICVNYKKRITDATFEGPDAKVIHENWCTLYDTGCTSPSRSADVPECLRYKVIQITKDYTKHKLATIEAEDKRGDLLARLQDLLQN